MKSKPGENFLSLQCKDSTPDPLPPLYLYRSVFTHGHLWRLQRGNMLISFWKSYLLPLYNDGVGKLFRTSRSNCKCSCAIYLTFALKFTYELLSLQARSSDPLPPPYLYIVKIENLHPILTPSLSVIIWKGHLQYNWLNIW